jgi:hypothetical protein
VDLRIVPDIDRKLPMKKEMADRDGMGMGPAEIGEFTHHPSAPAVGFDQTTRECFDHHGRDHGPPIPKTDQGSSPNARMFVENRLATIRVENRIGGSNDFGLTPAEPEAAMSIEVAHIAHAMPDTVPIPYLGPGGGLGKVVIVSGYGRPGRDDLTGLTGR